MKSLVKIAIIDDHKIFRTGLEVILNGITNFQVIHSCADGKALLKALEKQIPDVLFMDIKLPDENGVDLTVMIKGMHPQIKVIALTMFGEIDYFNKMVDAGADGFLLKGTDIEELEKAVKEVIEGRTYFAKEFLGHLTFNLRRNNGQIPGINLSDREREVLTLICEGYSNNEIAERLFISPHTVDGHRRNLITKTGVKNAPNLVLFAIKNGLLD